MAFKCCSVQPSSADHVVGLPNCNGSDCKILIDLKSGTQHAGNCPCLYFFSYTLKMASIQEMTPLWLLKVPRVIRPAHDRTISVVRTITPEDERMSECCEGKFRLSPTHAQSLWMIWKCWYVRYAPPWPSDLRVFKMARSMGNDWVKKSDTLLCLVLRGSKKIIGVGISWRPGVKSKSKWMVLYHTSAIMYRVYKWVEWGRPIWWISIDWSADSIHAEMYIWLCIGSLSCNDCNRRYSNDDCDIESFSKRQQGSVQCANTVGFLHFVQ